MTDIAIIRRVEQMCVKNGNILVQNVANSGTFQLIVPVIVGDDEFDPEQIATFDLEYSIMDDDDGEWVEIYNFPHKLLTNEDYEYVCEIIEWERNKKRGVI